MNNKRSFLLAATAGILASCGGGGDSSDTSTHPGTITLNQQYVIAPEARDIRIAGSFGGHRQVSVVSENRTQVHVSISEDSAYLVVRPLEVDRPRTLKLSLVFGKDRTESPVSLTVYVENSSSSEMEQQVRDLLDQRDALVYLEQEQVLYRYFLDLAYLRGEIGYARKSELIEAFQPSGSAHYTSTRLAFSQLRTNHSNYQGGSLPDYRLQESLAEVKRILESHMAFGAQKLEEISSYTALSAPGFNQAMINSTPEYTRSGVYGRFLSSAFGRFEGDTFILDAAYTPLKSLIRSDKHQEIACETI